MTIFFIDSLLSLLSSFIIINKYKFKKIIFIIENNSTQKNETFEYLKLIIKNSNIKYLDLIEVKYNYEYKSITNLKYKKYLKTIFFERLNSNASFDYKFIREIFTPISSHISIFLKNNKTKLNIIEHGDGEYIFLHEYYLNKKILIKKIIFKILNVKSFYDFNKIYLISNKVKTYKFKKLVYLNSKKFTNSFFRISNKVIRDYFIEISSELNFLKKKKLLIYFPSNKVDFKNYDQIISKKFLLKFKKFYTVIKRHPNDIHLEYIQNIKSMNNLNYFKNRNIESLPAEALVFYLMPRIILGHNSSIFITLNNFKNLFDLHILNDNDIKFMKLNGKELKNQIVRNKYNL